jgi:zinc-ribbon domain
VAAFCTNCGSPLSEGQAFCAKCGARIAGPTAPASAGAAGPLPSASPVVAAQPTPPSPAQTVSATSAPTKGSPLMKILLAVAVIFALFGAISIAGMIYVGHRVHKKMAALGLNGNHVSTLTGIDACRLLSKDDVSQTIGMEVVRAEASSGGSPGCVYNVAGDPADMTAKHLSQLTKQMSKDNQQQMSKSQQDKAEDMAKNFFHGTEAAQGSSLSQHSGEAPVLTFSIDDNAAPFQMKLNKGMLGQLGPLATANIPDLGDEAFDVAGAVMLVRKGDKLVRVMYMTCPCSRDDVVPLMRKVVAGL